MVAVAAYPAGTTTAWRQRLALLGRKLRFCTTCGSAGADDGRIVLALVSGEGRAVFPEAGGLFECVRELENAEVVVGAADDLDADR